MPLAHLSGRAVDKKRGDLTAERKKPLTENDKVDGIVEKVEKTGDDAKDVRSIVQRSPLSPARHRPSKMSDNSSYVN
jgi:hypothetical protein